MKQVLTGCDVLPPLDESPPKASNAKPKKAGGRFEVVNTFADFSMAKLSRAEIAVWLLLWRDTKKNGLARTSQADLSRRAGVNERTARQAVSSLADVGLLTVVRRGGLLRGPSSYRVHPFLKDFSAR